VGGYYEWDGAQAKTYYSLGGVRVAERVNGAAPLWLFGDHLGSQAITANNDGSFLAEVRYKPWGADRYTNGTMPTTYRFTGQRLDTDARLYYYGARYYDYLVGRFAQPDTVVPDPGDPQSLNRYSYANNNALKYVDPSGHWAVAGLAIGGFVGFLYGYGSQVNANLKGGMDLGKALTTDIDTGKVARYTLLGAATGSGVGMVADMAGLATVAQAAAGGVTAAQGAQSAGSAFQQLRAVANQNFGGQAKFEDMHWIPGQFHTTLRKHFQGISTSILNDTDPLERGFHKIVHGKWGTSVDAYNARVGDWLKKNTNATLQEFLDFIKDLKVEYLEQYQQYLVGN
jgi:RHS repeat-associated protein